MHSIEIVRFWDREIAKEKFKTAKRSIKIWVINCDNIVISKLVKAKTNTVRLLALIMPKMSDI